MTLLDTKVILIQVRTSAEKVKFLTQTVQSYFLKKEPFLIFVDDEKTASYVDELLWSHPAEFFLPHAIVQTETKEIIAITKEKKNINAARFAFNLCSTPLLIEGPLRIIYDFDDNTSPHKKNLSETRFEAYKQARFIIESSLQNSCVY